MLNILFAATSALKITVAFMAGVYPAGPGEEKRT
jgi:hypothetical protein